MAALEDIIDFTKEFNNYRSNDCEKFPSMVRDMAVVLQAIRAVDVTIKQTVEKKISILRQLGTEWWFYWLSCGEQEQLHSKLSGKECEY